MAEWILWAISNGAFASVITGLVIYQRSKE